MFSNIIIVLCFGFMFAGIFFYYKLCYLKLLEIRNDIKDAYNSLSEFLPEQYNLKYEEINTMFLKNISLKYSWIDYSKSFTKHREKDDIVNIYCVADVREYFSIKTVTHHLSMPFWQSYGGYFTGLGILGTFAGLSAGLFNLDIASTDIEVLKGGISELLSGVRSAFYTSLGGIGIALAYNVIHNRILKGVQVELSLLTDKIDEMYPRRPAEQWLAFNHEIGIEQTKTMKNLSTEMAETLGEILDQQLSGEFEKLCNKLTDELKPIFEHLSKAIDSLNSSGASVIADTINDQAGKQLKSFAESLVAMQEGMEKNITLMQNTTETVNKQVMATLEKLSTSLTNGAREAADTQNQAMANMSEKIDTLIGNMNTAMGKICENLQKSSTESQQVISDSLIRINNSTSDNVDMLNSMMREMTKGINDLCSKIYDQMDGNKKYFGEIVEQINGLLKQHGESIEAEMSRLDNLMAAIDVTLENVQDAGESIEEAALPVRSASETLSRELEVFSDEMNKLDRNTRSQLEYLIKTNYETSGNIEDLRKLVESSNDKLSETWKKHSHGFDKIGKEIEGATEALAHQLSDYNKKMNEGLSNSLCKFDGQFNNVISDLTEFVEAIEHCVDKIKKVTMGGK